MQSFGSLTGLTWNEARKILRTADTDYDTLTNGTHGETCQDFAQRIKSFYNDLITGHLLPYLHLEEAEAIAEGEPLGLVSPGSPLKLCKIMATTESMFTDYKNQSSPIRISTNSDSLSLMPLPARQAFGESTLFKNNAEEEPIPKFYLHSKFESLQKLSADFLLRRRGESLTQHRHSLNSNSMVYQDKEFSDDCQRSRPLYNRINLSPLQLASPSREADLRKYTRPLTLKNSSSIHICVISHGGNVQQLLNYLTKELSFKVRSNGTNIQAGFPKHGAIYRIQVDRTRSVKAEDAEWSGLLTRINDAGHLAKMVRTDNLMKQVESKAVSVPTLSDALVSNPSTILDRNAATLGSAKDQSTITSNMNNANVEKGGENLDGMLHKLSFFAKSLAGKKSWSSPLNSPKKLMKKSRGKSRPGQVANRLDRTDENIIDPWF